MSVKCHRWVLSDCSPLLQKSPTLEHNPDTVVVGRRRSRPMKANQTTLRAARLDADLAQEKFTAAERRALKAKVAVRAAKAAYKQVKKSLKLARKKAKAARKSLAECRDLNAEAKRKLRKVEKKAVQSRPQRKRTTAPPSGSTSSRLEVAKATRVFPVSTVAPSVSSSASM